MGQRRQPFLRPGRLLEWVFSTPTIHRWHHSIDVVEANHNYGAEIGRAHV